VAPAGGRPTEGCVGLPLAVLTALLAEWGPETLIEIRPEAAGAGAQ
jgi:L,D-peptidoglycan transpeptidase YkuD (ErfK/YbiS/YcfS/YnhG family)